mgnify:FL=1|tara:strand:+ start:436 stop:825 length:390 start_codon:yes stop_codon:yes gene_type:complete
MNLIKFPKITSDAFVINSEIILDASTLTEAYVVGATCVATFGGNNTDSILTITVDGTTANRLVSATAFMKLLTETCQTLAGPNGVSRGIFDFVPEAKTTAGKTAFEARFGGIIDATATVGTIINDITLT